MFITILYDSCLSNVHYMIKNKPKNMSSFPENFKSMNKNTNLIVAPPMVSLELLLERMSTDVNSIPLSMLDGGLFLVLSVLGVKTYMKTSEKNLYSELPHIITLMEIHPKSHTLFNMY